MPEVSDVRRGVLAVHADCLPLTGQTPRISLGEGETPLLPAPAVARAVGGGMKVWLKWEGANPTGSFKDRGMVLAIAKALESGSRAVACASTGNTAASAAAYAARFGLKCLVVVPAGHIAMGKLAQAMVCGAKAVAVRGSFDQALTIVRELAEGHGVTLVNSVNPFRLEGQKTAAFEVVDDLGCAPDCLCLPVGNAGNITAYWAGFKQYHAAGRAASLPRMLGFQAAGAAPLVTGAPVLKPETFATAIRIGAPASREGALAARDESGGLIDSVTDEEIRQAWILLAREEGVFAEPASASSVAGLLKASRAGRLAGARQVVCVLTGHGLKDPEAAFGATGQVEQVEADIGSVARAAGLA